MNTAEYRTLDPDQTKTLWHDVYVPAFEPIRAMAPQRHCMWWEEFVDLTSDPNVFKYVTTDDDGHPIGLGFLTNDLTAVPLIEPAYYQRQFPAEYEDKTLWYLISLCSRPDRDDAASVYAELLTTMSARPDGGIGLLDFSTWSIDARHLDRRSGVILSRHLGRRIIHRGLDAQVYQYVDFRH
jgi:hypothetical protein